MPACWRRCCGGSPTSGSHFGVGESAGNSGTDPPCSTTFAFRAPSSRSSSRSSFWRSTSRRSFGQSRSSEAAAIYGRPCSQSSRLEAKPKAKAEPTAAQNAQAELDAGVLQEEELAALAQGGDPLHRILALQLQQTAALTQRLTSRLSSDPITNVLGSEGGSSNSNGVRGCVARDAYLRALTDIPGVGRIIMMNAASDLGLSELQIGSGLMRQYVERRVPLGDHRLLTYMAQFMACSWQVAYDHQDELALGLFARGLMLIEQISLDKGRCQFGWLLTGCTEPDLAQISMRKQRLGIKPYAKLAAAP